MANTVAYQFYTDIYHGTVVEEDSWDHVSQLAFAHLERLKKLTRVQAYGDVEECESMAICAMAEVIQTWEDATVAGDGVMSETIGSVHESYSSVRDIMPNGFDRALYDAMRPWLHICTVVY